MNKPPDYEICWSQSEGRYFLCVYGHDVDHRVRFKTFEEAEKCRAKWMIEDAAATIEAEQNRKDGEEDERGDYR